MTTEELAELARLASAADGGPVSVERRPDEDGSIDYIVYGNKGDIAACFETANSNARANAAFVAALRNAAPALISLAQEALAARWVECSERMPKGEPREIMLWVRSSDGGYHVFENWKPGWACPRYVSHWRERVYPPPPTPTGKDGEQ